ncbi:MAG: thrombospondin type 3 repeat-containing protein [Verrucomicrobia bacterium]|nr:thrombospondin type 3 repeat-containing protein [Verrucomicrobiota bacterium]
MSWFSQNYEKAAVGGAAVAALGFAFLGWFKVGSVPTDFNANTQGSGSNDSSIPSADLVPMALASLALNHAWTQAETDGRIVDLFTGIPLYIERDRPDKPLDLLKSPAIHSPIPNPWWIEHRLDPGFADSPNRDADGDGYTNLEEFKGKTDPNDPKSHPPLIAKLMFEKDDSLNWFIRPGFPDGDKFTFKYGDTAGGKNQTKTGITVKPGELFFADGVMKNRFKYLGMDKRMEMNNATHTEMEVIYAKIEDQIPNKKGALYEIPQFPEGRIQEFSKYDRSAILSLEAIGSEGKKETIKENTTFGLPFDSPKKDYLLKKVTPEQIEVEYPDTKGEKKSVTIRKGAFPETSP